MPQVTVVMAVYNAAQFLHEAVTSVFGQTYSDFELIAVDDASSDESLSILESFTDARMRIIRHPVNLGAALSRNDAVAAAQGEFVAIMDADDVCAATRLSRQVSFLEAHPLVGVVGCGVYDNIDEKGAALSTSYLPRDNETIQRSLMEQWCFLHSSIMFRREFLERAGGYRQVFEPAEDHDLVLRVLECCQAHNLYEPLVKYRLNPKGLSVTGHQHASELRDAAIRLAQRRRSGHPEDLETEMDGLRRLKGMRRPPTAFRGAVQRWRDSLYAAGRYYRFGHHELCAGDLEKARRCFLQSVRTNGLFLKSWVGIAYAWMLFAASRLSRVTP